MQLAVAVGMQELQVACVVHTPMHLPNDVVDFPASFGVEVALTHRTLTGLGLPEQMLIVAPSYAFAHV